MFFHHLFINSLNKSEESVAGEHSEQMILENSSLTERSGSRTILINLFCSY